VKTAAYLARHLHMTSAEYRKTLSILRSHIRIIENNLRTRDYSFDYSKTAFESAVQIPQGISAQ